jgi:hypothetical protein
MLIWMPIKTMSSESSPPNSLTPRHDLVEHRLGNRVHLPGQLDLSHDFVVVVVLSVNNVRQTATSFLDKCSQIAGRPRQSSSSPAVTTTVVVVVVDVVVIDTRCGGRCQWRPRTTRQARTTTAVS